MIKVEEIIAAIETLPHDQYNKFKKWFLQKEWEEWDRQIEIDSRAGKLDFLIEEALEEKRKGKLEEI
ncbi:MAG: hypothetical protein GXO74_15560 [Calditrichaeota bacterium]|nr:hypothetical protein [Calditrichota bacterium]